MLLVTGLLLLMADQAKKTHKKVSLGDAFAVGIAQAIAISTRNFAQWRHHLSQRAARY